VLTIKNYLISLKTALGWAVEQKLLPSMPAFPTIKVPKKKPQQRWDPSEEWRWIDFEANRIVLPAVS
jgi:hypothetical protein